MISFLFCDYNILSFKYAALQYWQSPLFIFSQGVILHWWLMLKIPSYSAVQSVVSLGTCMTATWILAAWTLQSTIRQDSHHQQKWCLSSVLWGYSHVDCVWTSCRQRERDCDLDDPFLFPSSYFSLKGGGGGSKERNGRRILFDISSLLREYSLFPPAVRYLFVSSVDIRIKAALGINDFGLRLH